MPREEIRAAKMTDRTVRAFLKKFFTLAPTHIRVDKYVHVGLGKMPKKALAKRAAEFIPTKFFDVKCPQCKPFLEEGAFICYEELEIFAVRRLPKGLFETVFLTPSRKQIAAN